MPNQPDRPLQRDLARLLRQHGMFGEAQSAWVLSVANEIAKGRFTARIFRDGELILTTGSLPVAELQLAKDQLKDAINKKLRQEIVRTIRVKQSES